MQRLLEPWLGAGAGLEGLPLPALIDVTLSRDAPADLDALRRRLQSVAPAAVVDDHRAWFGRLLRLARGVQVAAAAVVALIASSVAAVVVLATRATLAANRDVLEVLHLIGARDSFVARQFQAHAVRLSLRGALVGLSLTLLVGAGLLVVWVGPDAAGAMLRRHLEIGHLAGLLAVPAMAVAIATLTARWAVLRELSRMV
jgi:cell division transport system permease protein